MDITALQHGAQLHADGRLVEAEAAYRALMDGPPQQAAVAHYLLGLVLTDRDDRAGALDQYDAAIALGAASADLHFRRGELLRMLEQPQAALESYDRALGKDDAFAPAHHARGVVLAALGDTTAALDSYDRAVALDPDAVRYWNNRGVALEAAGRIAGAVESYDRAVQLDPDYVQAHHNRGSALLKAGRFEGAIASFNEALRRNPAIPESWNFRAVGLASLELYAEALESSDQALALRPDYPEAHNNRSIALRALKRHDAALATADAALAVRPDFAEALNSRGSALIRLNRYEEARDAYRRAVDLNGGDAAVHLNLGMALEALGDLEGAQTAFARSHALAPEKPDARFASGLAHIRAGDIRAGFKLYETRWTQKGGPRHAYPEETLWLGETPLGNRTLLIHAEQGFGDVIQFCRFAPRVQGRVVLEVQRPLKRLIGGLEGVRDIRAVGDPPPDFDVHIPIMSLPLALDLGLEDVATPGPYLHAEPALVEAWRRKLPTSEGPRVGLVWSGNPGHDNDHNRSMSLADLAPILGAPAQFISLQKDYREGDRALLADLPILRFEDGLNDFADTAALIAACDLVIAVDTAAAHLAGALDKPLWLMLPRFSDWRWMDARADSPWYPSAQLYRQAAFGVWADVIERVRRDLERLVRPRGA